MTTSNTELNRGFRIGEVLVEPQREQLTVAGQIHHIEPKVMQVLVELAANAGQPVTRDSLLERVWSDTVVGEEVLSRAVSLLRSTLGDERTNPKFIRTLPRRGYELIQSVEPLSVETAAKASKTGVGAPYRFWFAGAGAFGLIVMLVAFGWVTGNGAQKVMVLMPLQVSEAKLGGVAKGLNDALHNLISGSAGLQLVARSWSFAVRDPEMAAEGVARQFDADYVLEGALSKTALRYELSVELVDAGKGASLWRKRFSAVDAQSLSSRVLSSVRDALNERAGAKIGALPAARAPLNEEAYQVYLQARHHWSLRGSEHIGRAAALLKRSIELDPGFAAARMALAQVIALEPFYTARPVLEQFERARVHLDAALRADPSLTSQVQALEGFMLLSTREWQSAGEMLSAALASDPNNAQAHYWLSMYWGALGDYQTAFVHALRAVELEPATPVLRDRLGVTYLWLNDLAAAEEEFARAERLGFALDFRSKAYPLFLYRAGRFEELTRLLVNLRMPRDWVEVFVAGLQDPGQRDRAVAASEAAVHAGQIPREWQFGVWVVLQEAERAIAAFDYSFKSPDIEWLWAKECEMLADAPGYGALLQALDIREDYEKRLNNNKIARPKKA